MFDNFDQFKDQTFVVEVPTTFESRYASILTPAAAPRNVQDAQPNYSCCFPKGQLPEELENMIGFYRKDYSPRPYDSGPYFTSNLKTNDRNQEQYFMSRNKDRPKLAPPPGPYGFGHYTRGMQDLFEFCQTWSISPNAIFIKRDIRLAVQPWLFNNPFVGEGAWVSLKLRAVQLMDMKLGHLEDLVYERRQLFLLGKED